MGSVAMTADEIAKLRERAKDVETSPVIWEWVNGERVFVGDTPGDGDAWGAAGELYEVAKHVPKLLDEIERLTEEFTETDAALSRTADACDVHCSELKRLQKEAEAHRVQWSGSYMGALEQEIDRLRKMITDLGLEPDAGVKR